MPNATWNPGDMTGMSLSGGNLIATSTTTAAGVRAISSYTSGKYYWECTATNWNGGGQIGIANAAVNLATVAGAGVGACVIIYNGSSYNNNAPSGISVLTVINGSVIGFAVDLTAKLFWIRVSPSGAWNGNASYNPATGTGGINIAAICTSAIYPLAGSSANGAVLAGNFGDTAFSGAVPSGFTAGWPSAAAGAAQARVVVMA